MMTNLSNNGLYLWLISCLSLADGTFYIILGVIAFVLCGIQVIIKKAFYGVCPRALMKALKHLLYTPGRVDVHTWKIIG